MKILKSFVAAMGLAAVTAASAQTEVNVLRLAPPGANTAAWSEAIAQTLTENGYKTNMMGFKNCQEGAKWLKDNPTAPVITMNFSDPFLLNIVDPTNPAACNFPVNNDSLIAIGGKWFHFICGHDGKGGSVKDLLAADRPKIGSWNSPVQMKIVKDQMADIGVKDAKVIGYAAGKDQMQAFVSGDLDYIVLSSENLAASLPGGVCFATSAETKYAIEKQRTSYSMLNPNSRHKNSGLWPILVGYNVDVTNARKVLGNGGPHSKLQEALQKVYLPVTDTIDVQLRDIKQRAESIKE